MRKPFLRRLLPTACFAIGLAACGGGAAGSGSTSLVPTPGSTPQAIISVSGNNLDFTGTINYVFTGGFHLEVGKGAGYNTVYTTPSTMFVGAKPYVGETVEVIGTGSFSTTITATTVKQIVSSTPTPQSSTAPTTPPGPSGAPFALPAGTYSIGGTVASTYTGGVRIEAGVNYGYMHINIDGSTLLPNGYPKIGQYVYVTGPGQLGYTLTANVVSIYPAAPGSTTVSGSVSAVTSYGFLLSTSLGSVPIALTSATVVAGGTLAVGAQLKVTGIGSSASSITAVQIVVIPPPAPPTPTPAPISMTHVLTGDYLGGMYGTHNVSWNAAAPFLTWAQTDSTDAAAIHAAGIKTQLYVEPNYLESDAPMYYISSESDFAHDCSGNRVTVIFDNIQRYVTDPNSTTLQQHLAEFVNQQLAAAPFDDVFEDNAGPLTEELPYGKFSAMPCNYSDASWITGGLELDHASPLPIVANGINVPNGPNVSAVLQLFADSNTIGGNFEGCYADTNKPAQVGSFWLTSENTEIQTVNQGKVFECMQRYLGVASSSIASRIYAYASFLLTYNPQNSIMWEEYITNSGFHVEPETELVALSPKVAEPAAISGLLQTGGTYGREYTQCFVAGQFVGACAVVVNPDSAFSHTFPFPQYQHSLVLTGGGVLDGGTIATNGPPPPTSLAPGTAEIVFP